jgi:Raf kinase inhibitor-like YbhB/YbcL family protein
MTLELTSSAFVTSGAVPKEHTCDGRNTPPPLEWSGAPAGTASFALIVDDPDAPDPKAPKRTYVHWVAYDISKSMTRLGGGDVRPGDVREGLNDAKTRGYTGPCPPIGRHRYFFKLYALDVVLGDLGETTKSDLEQAMRGHVLEHAELIGTYQRGRGRA